MRAISLYLGPSLDSNKWFEPNSRGCKYTLCGMWSLKIKLKTLVFENCHILSQTVQVPRKAFIPPSQEMLVEGSEAKSEMTSVQYVRETIRQFH